MMSFIGRGQGIPVPGPTAREVPLTDSSINMNASLKTADREHLGRALELAELGRGKVSPNPLVGAVVVRDGEVVGEGFHAKLGDLHAERAALADCESRGEDSAGATMYVTLEPCAHQGRQPPCVEAILEAGIGRVVIASDDPSEKAAGRGPGMLRDGEVKVEFAAGEEATAARLLNQPFRKHARTGLPLVTLKLAMSLDGQTETRPGDSPWISGTQSQELVHRWRAESDAIAVGIGTVLVDDPLLTARGPEASRQPIRVVFDRQARLPLNSQLLQTLDVSSVVVVVSQHADAQRIAALRDRGAEILVADDIKAALSDLGRRSITSLFLEGGRTLASAFLAKDVIDKSRTFIAPTLLGDPGGGTGGATPEQRRPVFRPTRDLGRPPEPQAKNPASGRGTPGPALHHTADTIGDDILITARFKEW
jgi:diaminohydroxyphosphoribosylaminopyrimidine deaminase / 5-amino-6-(5-phosphoribosylamino)uracil reductase